MEHCMDWNAKRLCANKKLVAVASQLGKYNRETLWAVGIAQLTHHEVCGGCKYHEIRVAGFLPPPRTELWGYCVIPTAHDVFFHPTLCMCEIFSLLEV